MRAVIFHHIEGEVKWWKDQLNTWYLKIKSISKASFQHSNSWADLFCYPNPLHTCYSAPFLAVSSNAPLTCCTASPAVSHGNSPSNASNCHSFRGSRGKPGASVQIHGAESAWMQAKRHSGRREAFLFIGVWILRARKTGSSSHRAHKLLYRLVPVIRTVRLTRFPTAPLLEPK